MEIGNDDIDKEIFRKIVEIMVKDLVRGMWKRWRLKIERAWGLWKGQDHAAAWVKLILIKVRRIVEVINRRISRRKFEVFALLKLKVCMEGVSKQWQDDMKRLEENNQIKVKEIEIHIGKSQSKNESLNSVYRDYCEKEALYSALITKLKAYNDTELEDSPEVDEKIEALQDQNSELSSKLKAIEFTLNEFLDFIPAKLSRPYHN